MSIVFSNGCFDILHVGHFKLFRFCEQLVEEDGKLFIALDSDEKVKKDKGKNRPIFTLEERKKSIEILDLKNLEEIYSFNTNEELHEIIKSVSPDIIVKSKTWENNVVGSDISKVIYFNFLEKFSTSMIVERILLKHDCRSVMIDKMLETIRNR